MHRCTYLSSMFHLLFCYRAAAASGDIRDPQQQDCAWSEQGDGSHADKYDPLGQNIPVEPALEATEFTVSAIESEKRQFSIKRDKSNQEGSIAIEMSAQPLLELTPMTGSTGIAAVTLYETGFVTM